MKTKEYKYDAFISYRHCDLDKYVAENIHRILETYELPSNIKEKLNIKGKTFKRLFRDQDELPLSSNLEDPILDALNNSKYLIVICSPRLKDSLWCKKEIQTFKKIRGRKNIFCVLIEGEPSESFPEEVLYDEEKVLEKGKTKIVKKPVEPLAADVRGKNKADVLKRIKEEKLRLAAAMYQIDYDDLKQRHKLREQKRKMNILMAVTAASIIFVLYTSLMLIKINSQQKVLKHHQAITLASKSKNYLKKDKRYDAIKSSYQALTKFKGVKMPYTSEAEYALIESLGVYDVGSSYKVVSDIKTDGVADFIKASDDNKYAAVYDEAGKITLFKTNSLKVINKYEVNKNYFNEDLFSFIGNDIFSYVNEQGNICLVNIKDNKQIKEIKKNKESYMFIKGDPKGNYLVYSEDKKVLIYDIKNNKELLNTEYEESVKSIYYSSDSNNIFVGTEESNYDINKEDYINLHVINIKDRKETNNLVLTASGIYGLLTIDNNAYILLNKYKGIEFESIVVSYNYDDGIVNWTKNYDNKWGRFINRSYDDSKKHLAFVSYDTVFILDRDNGEEISSYVLSNEIINIYSYFNKELYLVFQKDGHVIYVNPDNKNSIEYKGKYVLNLDNYSKVELSENGFLLIPTNENRVVLYEAKSNKNIKEIEFKKEEKETKSVKYTDYDKIKEEYSIKNKNLVDKMIYDDKKELLFVNYVNKDLTIYNTKDKKVLKELKNVGTIDTYFGKDNDNRIYIGDISNSYILDSNYNKVGHIKSLVKVDKNKLIISNDSKYYSIKIYNLKELLKEADEYLK